MSWDISVFACSDRPLPLDQLPKDWRSEKMGSGDEVRAMISTYLPGVNWSDPTWGLYDGDGFSLEFNMGSEEPKDGFMVHVRGGGDPIAALMRFARPNGWFCLDCSSGDWLEYDNPSDESWKGFQVYRDRVIRRTDTGV